MAYFQAQVQVHLEGRAGDKETTTDAGTLVSRTLSTALLLFYILSAPLRPARNLRILALRYAQ